MRNKQMKIDYELVNKIGATHYCDKTYRLYKVSAMTLLVYINDDWKLCLAGVAALDHIKPIPTKRTRTEYERVTESIFDLRDEFERGDLYMWLSDEYLVVPNETQLSILLDHKQCYRQVEIDWRDEVKKLDSHAIFYDDGDLYSVIDSNSNDFISMCHEIASLTEKPTN